MVALYTISLDATRLGEAALDRIIEAGGLKPKKAPNPFPEHPEHCDDSQSRNDLRFALLAAEARYRFDVDRRGEGRNAARRKRIAGGARELAKRIASDPSLEFHRLPLEQLARDSERPPPRPLELGSIDLSAFDNLIGELMRAFEQASGRKATYTKDTIKRSFGGHFIRFAQRTLIELQIDKREPRTIANAVDRIRHSPKTVQG
jgi:hypothetical protein